MSRKAERRAKRERSKRKSARSSRRRYRAARASAYGPVPFQLQTDAVRARGRRSLNKGKSRVRRRSASSSSQRGTTRKARRAANRAAFRAQVKRTRKSARKGKSGKKARRFSRKEYVARRIQTANDYVALKKYRKANYGPIPFEMQPSWLRAKMGKAYRTKRARWAKARSR